MNNISLECAQDEIRTHTPKPALPPQSSVSTNSTTWAKKIDSLNCQFQRRAKNGTRTRDPNLGKVVLYQLSYFRILFHLRSTHQFHSFPCQGWKTFFISWGKVVLYQLSYFRIIFHLRSTHQFHSFPCQGWKTFFISWGKVVLYQLSYFRIISIN